MYGNKVITAESSGKWVLTAVYIASVWTAVFDKAYPIILGVGALNTEWEPVKINNPYLDN